MDRLRLGTVALAALLSLASPAQQRPEQSRQVSLKQALQLAARQGPDVTASRAQAAIARASVRRAWTSWQPDLSATGTFDHTSAPAIIPPGALGPGSPQVTIVAPNSRFGTFQISQPLFSPQGLFLPGIANATADAADRGADEAREQTLLGVARTYLGLQGLAGLLAAAREAEQVALRREQDARARIAAGTEVEIGLLRAQTESAQARAQIANYIGQVEGLLPLLEALTGDAVEPQPGIVDVFGSPAEPGAQPWENAFAVRSAAAQVLSANRATTYDDFLWLPSISGVARENYNSNGGFSGRQWSYDLIVNVTVPIYDRGLRYAQRSEDLAKLALAQANLASVRARARSTWVGARANWIAAQAVLQQTEAQAQLAARTQAQVEASARAGVATSLDLSDADQKKFAAESAAAQARAELQIRRADIAAAEGRLFELSR